MFVHALEKILVEALSIAVKHFFEGMSIVANHPRSLLVSSVLLKINFLTLLGLSKKQL